MKLFIFSVISLAGCGEDGQTPQNISTSKTVKASATGTLSQSKVFIAATSTEAFTVSDSGVTVYGGSGREVITIASGVNSITLDQNIDRVNLPGTSNEYTFKQMGNQLVVYQGSPILTIPIQGDNDGTQLGFSNGGAYDIKMVAGVLTLGGTPIRSDAPATVSPVTPTSATEPTPVQLSSAKIFMGNNDFITVANNGAKVYGGSGSSNVLTVSPDTYSITFDQNISEVRFSGPEANYKFMQTGNLVNIYDANSTLIARGPVQGSANGTLLTFANGTGSAKFSSGIMQLGGSTISTVSPAPITSSVFSTSTSVTTSSTTTLATTSTTRAISTTTTSTTATTSTTTSTVPATTTTTTATTTAPTTTTTTSTTTTTLPTGGGSIIFVW